MSLYVHASCRSMLAALFMLALGSPAARAAEPLAWKFEPGLSNRYRMTQETKVEKTGAGGDATVNSTLTIDTSWTVKEVKPDGAAVLEQKIDRLRMNVSTGEGQKAEIDTAANEEPQGQGAMLAPLFKALTGQAFTVTMTPRGDVTEVEIPEAVGEALKNQPGAAQMGDLATPEGFKKMVSQASFVLPEKLEPGAEWTTTSETKLPAVGTQTATTTYRYEGPKEVDGKSLEAFSAKIDLKFAGGEVNVEVVEQQSSGEVLFNREEGRLQSSSIKQVTELKITAAGQQVNQTIDQSIEMKWLPPDAE